MSNVLNEMQQLRLLFIKWSNFDLVEAEKMYDFVVNEQPKKLGTPIVKDEPKKLGTPIVSDRPDGIYFILSSNNIIHESSATDEDKRNSIAVGVKMGNKFANVTLNDAAEGKSVSLFVYDKTPDKITVAVPHNDDYDVISDWNGLENTNKLRNQLNPDINLSKDEYIPSMAQLFLILLNIKNINRALDEAGGKLIEKDWYWSSTDDNDEDYMWELNFNGGGYDIESKIGRGILRTSVICEFDNIN